MANVSRIKGFKPLKHLSGAPYNGQCNVYQFASGEAHNTFIGDAVVLAGDASIGGLPTIKQAAAGVGILGIVVGFVPVNTDPITGSLTTGGLTLDSPYYRKASTAQYALVCDADDVIYEVEGTTGGSAYTYLTADVGLNADLYVASAGDGNTSTGNSNMSLDVGGTKAITATLQFHIMGAVQRPDNETVGGTSTAVKYLAKINNASLGNGTGATGVA